MLRNPENLKGEQAGELRALLELNQPRMTVYLMKAQLKELWYARRERQARWRWTQWFNIRLWPASPFASRLAPAAAS
ncbi:transposase, IS204/IS1001/IS1096/IS1165 family protein [Alcanivorax xiamenensis]|uniref:Transposase, IS204/IS1001/IS1096/IS1165 family protein n=1 Tax=Alcanivorax xiamenensis TaxID=1177156 RepID=A0ABQ6Y7Y8_9GAMM|nr:transposase, IS204/IS1001/IS1096/IS1165 family protein [Alcanivorax xiamenensis]